MLSYNLGKNIENMECKFKKYNNWEHLLENINITS